MFYKTGTYAVGDNMVSKRLAARGISIKLINNVSDRQGVGLVLRYLLDCF